MPNIQVIVSPAKKMRTAGARTPADDLPPSGIPPFPGDSARLVERLKAMGRDELKTLWHTSDKLTDECCEDLRTLEVPRSWEQAQAPAFARCLTPAVLTYDGIQFRSMAPEVLDAGALAWLQEHLWILSGLHGCVRPFDAVAPYRLEMGARLAMDAPASVALDVSASGASEAPAEAPQGEPTRDLYGFWGTAIARRIEREADIVVNLASMEYAKAVVPHLRDTTACVTCVFGEDIKAGKPVQRSTASKAARGSMVRWMAERALADPAELTRFDVGYRFDEALSTPDRLVFMRAGA